MTQTDEEITMFLDWKNLLIYNENDCIIPQIYRFSAIPIKFLTAFFTELEPKNYNCVKKWDLIQFKRFYTAKETIKKKKKDNPRNGRK